MNEEALEYYIQPGNFLGCRLDGRRVYGSTARPSWTSLDWELSSVQHTPLMLTQHSKSHDNTVAESTSPDPSSGTHTIDYSSDDAVARQCKHQPETRAVFAGSFIWISLVPVPIQYC